MFTDTSSSIEKSQYLPWTETQRWATGTDHWKMLATEPKERRRYRSSQITPRWQRRQIHSVQERLVRFLWCSFDDFVRTLFEPVPYCCCIILVFTHVWRIQSLACYSQIHIDRPIVYVFTESHGKPKTMIPYRRSV